MDSSCWLRFRQAFYGNLDCITFPDSGFVKCVHDPVAQFTHVPREFSLDASFNLACQRDNEAAVCPAALTLRNRQEMRVRGFCAECWFCVGLLYIVSCLVEKYGKNRLNISNRICVENFRENFDE